MEFDLSEVLKDVSGPDTDKQQIRYIPLDQIDPDPNNFYSLDGLNKLAGSIEMLGLQQPLLVRPAKDGRFTVISGHRRRAALMLIRDGGSTQFADGVPCIVDYSEASDALRELKLIMANSDTRKMSSADQNTQAERLEDILRRLEDEGFEFPGRLRDWVSKLSGMSRTKLARLKVIRDGLEKGISKKYYKAGKLKEEPAYELARLPEGTQKAIVSWYTSRDTSPERWSAYTIKQYAEDLQRLETYVCPAKFGGRPCVNTYGIMERLWKLGYHDYCHCGTGKKCCATCEDLASCAHVCGHMIEKAEKLRMERRKKNKEIKEAEKKAQQLIVDRIRAIWLRFGNALGRANMEDEDLRKITGLKIYQLDSTQIASLEAGEYAPKLKAGCVLPFWNASYLSDIDRYIKTADALDCSLDYLFCRTDVPEVAKQAQSVPAVEKREISVRWLGWLTGEAPSGVKCWARFMDEESSEDFTMMATYDASADAWFCGDRLSKMSVIDQKCIGWWPLPDENALDLPADLTPQPVPIPDTAPQWRTGTPEKEGPYWCEIQCGKEVKRQPARWLDDTGWHFYHMDATFSAPVLRWYPLPEE